MKRSSYFIKPSYKSMSKKKTSLRRALAFAIALCMVATLFTSSLSAHVTSDINPSTGVQNLTGNTTGEKKSSTGVQNLTVNATGDENPSAGVRNLTVSATDNENPSIDLQSSTIYTTAGKNPLTSADILAAYASDNKKPFSDVYNMVTDPSTHRFAEHFKKNTLENGRIWVDKSVNSKSVTYYDTSGNPLQTITAGNDEFLITLATLSQSYSVDSFVEPSDVVFVLDVSASMDVYNFGNMSRAAVMVTALNKAIDTLMQADPENRVAVVAYGGATSGGSNVSKIYHPLSLGHYSVANGNYFTISGNRISVNADIPNKFVADRTVPVAGSTPTQRGIYDGAKILMDNDDTTYEYVTEKNKHVTVTRRPAIVLLTDGEPTMAWSDYTVAGAATDNGYDCGDGNPTSLDMGMSLLTVASASYWKQQVQDHYYANQNEKTQVFTIGVGVGSDYARAVMDPAIYAQGASYNYQGEYYNMKSLLDRWESGKAISLPVQNKGGGSRKLITIENTDNYVRTYNYTNAYFPANDDVALDAAFQTIANQIIASGFYTTQGDPSNPDFSGYLVMSDAIGEHMSFKEPKGIWVGGELYYGIHLAKEITERPETDAWIGVTEVLAERLGVSKDLAYSIIKNNIAAGFLYYNSDEDFRNAMRWYADEETEYVGPYFDENGDVNPPPQGAKCDVILYGFDREVYNEIAGEYTNLLYTYLSVTTALETGSYGLKNVPDIEVPLIAGQQLVRWYVPASLIPMRTVTETYDENTGDPVGVTIKEAQPIRANFIVQIDDNFTPLDLSDYYKEHNGNGAGGYYFYSNDWRFGEGRFGDASTNDTTISFFQPNKSNPYYFFTVETPLFTRSGNTYMPAQEYKSGTDYYVLKEYFDLTVPDYLAYEYALVNQRVTAISTDEAGVPYIEVGQRKKISDTVVMKRSNPTQTYDFSLDAYPIGDSQVYYHGNNGRLDIRDLTSVTARKVWRGQTLPSVWAALYADGAQYGDPVALKKENSWNHTWNELLTYGVAADKNGDVTRKTYTVKEGAYENGVFTPYSETNPLKGYTVSVTQPVWNDQTQSWSEAVITNTEDSYPEDTPEEVPGNNTPGDTPGGGTPGDVSGNVPGNTPRDVPENVPGNTAGGDTPGQTPTGNSGSGSSQTTETSSDAGSGRTTIDGVGNDPSGFTDYTGDGDSQNPSRSYEGNIPKTGDAFNLGAWLVIMLLAAGGLAILVSVLRAKDKRN